MAIDRKRFFAGIRNGPFPGKLTQEQVSGTSAILDEWGRRGLSDLRHLAYMLATTYHETAHTMQPVKEYGSQAYLRGKKYWPWIGRGYVQLTWKTNYQKFQARVKAQFGVDIIADMDAAMRPDVAAFIMFEGMYRGEFTGKKLADFFSAKRDDPVEARRIINGTDRAKLIAGYHAQFLDDLRSAA